MGECEWNFCVRSNLLMFFFFFPRHRYKGVETSITAECISGRTAQTIRFAKHDLTKSNVCLCALRVNETNDLTIKRVQSVSNFYFDVFVHQFSDFNVLPSLVWEKKSDLKSGRGFLLLLEIPFDPWICFVCIVNGTIFQFFILLPTSCQSDDIGFPSFASATPPGPGSLAYLKSSPYIIAVDSLHAIGYPTAGKSDQTKQHQI